MPVKKTVSPITEMSVNAYAKSIGVDEKAVREAIKKGIIKAGYDKIIKKIIVEKANKEYGDTKVRIKPQRGVSRARAIASNEQKEKKEKITEKQQKRLENLLDTVLMAGIPLSDITITADMELAEAMRLREIISLALDKKKLEEADRILVNREEVNNSLFNMGSELKKALFGIPPRIVRDIMSAETEVEAINIFNDELTLVLNSLTNMEIK